MDSPAASPSRSACLAAQPLRESAAGIQLQTLPSRNRFKKELITFCTARGITAEPAPKLKNKIVDLYDLFTKVVQKGGYDRVSVAEKGSRIWRDISTDLGFPEYLGFELKGVYLNNIAAYEFHKIHRREPPPVSLLEGLPAVGGDTLSRTVETYVTATELRLQTIRHSLQQHRSGTRVREVIRSFFSAYLCDQAQREAFESVQLEESIAQGEEPAESSHNPENEQTGFNIPTEQPSQHSFAFTPPREDMSASSNPRTSLREGLRQAPKANQPFIPDTAPVRQTRSGTHMHTPAQNNTASPQPTSSQSVSRDPSHPANTMSSLETFEGQDTRQVPMSTREVITPGNRPALFAAQRNQGTAAKQVDFYSPAFPLKYLDVPKSDSIYKRCYYGLQSGIPSEVDFALYHLVQISNQRWDKFKFGGFPLLAERLMVKAMEITLLCTGARWAYERDLRNPMDRVTTLNALQGTPDILDRIQKIPFILPDDTLEIGEFRDRLRNIKEATLVLRNMCTLDENARYITYHAKGLLRDFLVVLLNIPNQPRFNEIKNDALDIAEEVTRYMPTSPEDPLRISLFRCLESEDRAHIVRALRALTHFSTEMDPVPTRNYVVEGVPEECLHQLFYNTLLVQDKDILSGTMDFWYQFTLVPANVEVIIRMADLPLEFMRRMVSLLSYESRIYVHEDVIQEETIAPPPSEIPKVPTELLDALMKLSEPERSSRWLRCCFVEDAECEITQIALWQAYQSRFADPRIPGGGVLPAAEFIKNVSTTFTNAQAQVITGPDNATRFIIKGIRPLDTAHTFDAWPYLYCKWADDAQSSKRCGRAFATPTELRSHVFEEHMDLKPSEQPGHYKLEKADAPVHTCKWNNCTKFKSSGPSDDTVMVVEHVASHLPQDRDPNAQPPSTKRAVLQERLVRTTEYCDTPVDKNGDPVGVAYKAALVLRNIVKNLPPGNSDDRFRRVPWKDALFTNLRASIIDQWTCNRALRLILTDVIMAINKDWS